MYSNSIYSHKSRIKTLMMMFFDLDRLLLDIYGLTERAARRKISRLCSNYRIKRFGERFSISRPSHERISTVFVVFLRYGVVVTRFRLSAVYSNDGGRSLSSRDKRQGRYYEPFNSHFIGKKGCLC